MFKSPDNENKKVFVSKPTIFRLAKDVKEVINNPLTSHGIYYIHDPENFLVGRAMLIGPNDTPYDGLPMLFKFNFPESYPHDPPKAIFCTNDGSTRFHPNYYNSGKVCLSILNTWVGDDRWSGCQSITSILLTMISLLTDNPYIHEPGMIGTSIEAKTYKKMVDYACKRKIVDFIDNGFPKEFEIFYDEYKKYLQNNKQRLFEIFKSRTISDETKNIENMSCSVYSLHITIDYKKVFNKYENLMNKIL